MVFCKLYFYRAGMVPVYESFDDSNGVSGTLFENVLRLCALLQLVSNVCNMTNATIVIIVFKEKMLYCFVNPCSSIWSMRTWSMIICRIVGPSVDHVDEGLGNDFVSPSRRMNRVVPGGA